MNTVTVRNLVKTIKVQKEVFRCNSVSLTKGGAPFGAPVDFTTFTELFGTLTVNGFTKVGTTTIPTPCLKAVDNGFEGLGIFCGVQPFPLRAP